MSAAAAMRLTQLHGEPKSTLGMLPSGCPVTACLAQPGEALRKALTGHLGMMFVVAVSADGRPRSAPASMARYGYGT